MASRKLKAKEGGYQRSLTRKKVLSLKYIEDVTQLTIFI